MKDLIMKLLQAIAEFFRRFTARDPANAYEGIAFGAMRSALAVAFFPPGVPGVNADARG